MTKLSDPQRKALLVAIENERRTHRRYDNDEVKRTNLLDEGLNSTIKALARKGLCDAVAIDKNGCDYFIELNETGRKIAIDLLHENAEEVMAKELALQKVCRQRLETEKAVKATITTAYDLQDWEVQVFAHHSFYVDGYEHSIRFMQEREFSDGVTRRDDLVRIGWSNVNKYYTSTSGTSLDTKQAKRMAELLLIAVQVIESGILDSQHLHKKHLLID